MRPHAGRRCRRSIRSLRTLTPNRRAIAATQLQPLVKLLKLDPKEAETLAQSTFTAVDAEYLADCFLIRDAMKSLSLKNDPPLEQAERAFAWVCRQIYISNQNLRVAPPWWVLEAGSGSAIDRAYVFFWLRLSAIGLLDGCLIGPREPLGVSPELCEQDGKVIGYPIIWAVGARIGKDIFLFDPWHGKPIAVNSKTLTASLRQLRTDTAALFGMAERLIDQARASDAMERFS